MVRPLAEVEPYRRFGSEMAGGRYQDFEGMGTARDGQEHFPSEGFEQGDRGWEQLVTRALLERDVFWTQAQGVARCTLASTL